jgi:hypothetical protein
MTRDPGAEEPEDETRSGEEDGGSSSGEADDRQGLGALARSIVDSNLYLTLADAEGRPWASPVWFAHEDYRDFLWVSRPESRHSRNVEIRAKTTDQEGDTVVCNRSLHVHVPRRLHRRAE